MSDDKLADLIKRAQHTLATEGAEWEDLQEPLALVSALTYALDSTVREMHERELHHFETEQLLSVRDQEIEALKRLKETP